MKYLKLIYLYPLTKIYYCIQHDILMYKGYVSNEKLTGKIYFYIERKLQNKLTVKVDKINRVSKAQLLLEELSPSYKKKQELERWKSLKMCWRLKEKFEKRLKEL